MEKLQGHPSLLKGSNGYVIASEDEVGSMSETGDSVTKVLIPGLLDESNGEYGAPISSCFWE